MILLPQLELSVLYFIDYTFIFIIRKDLREGAKSLVL